MHPVTRTRDNEPEMGMPKWWDERRLGLLVHASVASVPAWAPVGGAADRYRAYLGEGDADDAPLVEVLAHHRDRWGHIEHFDDFVPLLHFTDFDADAWARLAVESGAGYAAVVARDRDGWAWWDAPTTTRTMTTSGPRRNVVAEFAEACERNGLPLGVWYVPAGSDRSEGAPSEHAVALDVTDLVERLGIDLVWLSSTRRSPGTQELVGELLAAAPSLVVGLDALDHDIDHADDHDDGATGTVVRVYDRTGPDDITAAPWQLRRDLGRGAGHNRAERSEHQLDATGIIAVLTEVVAKGGHLLLSVGTTADGAIPEAHMTALRAAGAWIREHDDLVHRGRPWTWWGDAEGRFVEVDGVVHAVDVGGRGHFPLATSARCPVEAVTIHGAAIPFQQDETGLHVGAHRSVPGARRDRSNVDVPVYRLTLATVERPAGLFDDVEPLSPRPVELASLLSGFEPGEIVQLGDGHYIGPATIPDGVIVRGLGANRTTIDPGTTPLLLGVDGRLEHVRIGRADHDGAPLRSDAGPSPVVVATGEAALILGCRVDGTVSIEAADVTLRATRAGAVRAVGIDRVSITRCHVSGFTGDRVAAGITLRGGSGHRVESCEIAGHRCGVWMTDTTETEVTGSNLVAGECGVRLDRTHGAHVHGNFISHSMRGIAVEGGSHALVHGNAVRDGDSGCVVAWGAAECSITGNTWERCRIGVLTWEASDLTILDNEAIDLHEPDAAVTVGP